MNLLIGASLLALAKSIYKEKKNSPLDCPEGMLISWSQVDWMRQPWPMTADEGENKKAK